MVASSKARRAAAFGGEGADGVGAFGADQLHGGGQLGQLGQGQVAAQLLQGGPDRDAVGDRGGEGGAQLGEQPTVTQLGGVDQRGAGGPSRRR